MLPELLAQIPIDEPIESVCADGAYDTRDCLDAIAQRHAMALIPPRKNAGHWKKSSPGSAHRNEAIRACKRLGRSIWKKWSGYHRRSLVETKMHCFKRLGERVSARTVRPPDCGVACPLGRAKSLQPDRPSSNRASGCCGTGPSGLGSCRCNSICATKPFAGQRGVDLALCSADGRPVATVAELMAPRVFAII